MKKYTRVRQCSKNLRRLKKIIKTMGCRARIELEKSAQTINECIAATIRMQRLQKNKGTRVAFLPQDEANAKEVLRMRKFCKLPQRLSKEKQNFAMPPRKTSTQKALGLT